MKDIFRLYINNKEVDFEIEPQFEFRYQQEDFSNPTIIKNTFSKSIKIEGTDNNNQIFGEIYNLDREQLYKYGEKTGVYFNPSKRTPFELYRNAELIESGYMQLTDITINNQKIVYNITLFGGLGDMFYSLMYTSEGEKRTLADLWYRIGKEESELEFKINKEFVKASWEKLKSGATGNTINDFVTFAPSYNGLYDDFDNSTICINTYLSQIFTNNDVTKDELNYTTYNGYKLAKTKREWTEFEVRDLRSYMQRPCLKFSKLLDAICDEHNNGGYKVHLSKSFFNSKNPFYNDVYMALPLLPTTTTNDTDTKKEYELYADANYYDGVMHIGKKGSTYLSTTYRLGFDGDDISASSSNGFNIDTSNIPITSSFDVDVDFDLSLVANSLDETMNNSELFLTYVQKDRRGTIVEPVYAYLPTYKSITVQAVMYGEGEEIYYSNMVNFTNPVSYGGNTYISTPDKWKNTQGEDFSAVQNCFGSFKREGTTNNYKWVDNEGNTTFKLRINDVPKKKNMGISLIITLRYSEYDNTLTPLLVTNQTTFESWNGATSSSSGVLFTPYYNLVNSYATAPLNATSTLTLKENGESVKSNTTITKKRLLQTEFSPCDVLLDYCKLFGLYFVKDLYSKSVSIMTKNEFFTGNVVDISNRIDMSKDMKITPYLFETKYYLMKSNENETYYSKKYKNEYNLVYGQKRIDTNYNFNKDTKDIYDGSVFQNAISVTDTSPYYRSFYSSNNILQPSWLMDNPTVELYNAFDTDEPKTHTEEYAYNKYINTAKTRNWNLRSGYDIFPKTAFYNLDDNAKSLSDVSATLLFFNGYKPTVDIDGNSVPFWVSDDVYVMRKLNDDMCYLYTECEVDDMGNTIAYKYNELPQFLRYKINGNTITESFDFGVPKEIYMPNVSYGENATLYDKFWKNYLTDRYDVNTRKVSCYVNLEGIKITQETLRDFYWFNNSLWAINKIENYLPNNYGTTKVEFVKINDTYNYLKAQYEYIPNNIRLSENEILLDWDATNYTLSLNSLTAWTASGNDIQITPAQGEAGQYNIAIATQPNNLEAIKNNIISFADEGGNVVEFNLKQLPSPKNAKYICGYVIDEAEEPLPNYTLTFGIQIMPLTSIDDTPVLATFITTTNTDGYYEIYVGKSFAQYNYLTITNEKGEQVYLETIDYAGLNDENKIDYVIKK